MTGHARLALPHDLRDFTNRKLHGAQKIDDAQPRRIAKGAKDVECGAHGHII